MVSTCYKKRKITMILLQGLEPGCDKIHCNYSYDYVTISKYQFLAFVYIASLISSVKLSGFFEAQCGVLDCWLTYAFANCFCEFAISSFLIKVLK
jgi:hypothetical protein